MAPSRSASAAWAGQRATVPTSTPGQSWRRIAVAVVPSAPAPITRARPCGGGGLRVTAWKETDHGSARTAASSGTASGTGNTIVVCAGSRSANPPVASVALPVWMPAESGPAWKFQQIE